MNLLKICILPTCPNAEKVREYYTDKIEKTSYPRDCGVDLIFPQNYEIGSDEVKKCGLGIACEFYPAGSGESGAYDLVPRSSIANTPLSLANSIGIIDPEYRGELLVAFRCHNKNGYEVNFGERYVQIVAPNRQPIRLELVEKLSETTRGSQGFGSTNK